jgi:hypothetical protein
MVTSAYRCYATQENVTDRGAWETFVSRSQPRGSDAVQLNRSQATTDRYQHSELHHVGSLMDARNQTRLEAMS